MIILGIFGINIIMQMKKLIRKPIFTQPYSLQSYGNSTDFSNRSYKQGWVASKGIAGFILFII